MVNIPFLLYVLPIFYTDEQHAVSGGVTLLSQLASMPSMSPLITSPVPSVGSVVPNMQNALLIPNGLVQQQAPEVSAYHT